MTAGLVQALAGSPTTPQAGNVFAAMAGPAVLLLVNAMLILSTIQRLQAILTRIRESEESLRREGAGLAGALRQALRHELELHGRRVRLAHRALFAFYASAGTLLVMIGALGAGAVGWTVAAAVAAPAAFAGAFLLLIGAALLTGETWVGVRATDQRVRRVLESFDRE